VKWTHEHTLCLLKEIQSAKITTAETKEKTVMTATSTASGQTTNDQYQSTKYHSDNSQPF